MFTSHQQYIHTIRYTIRYIICTEKLTGKSAGIYIQYWQKLLRQIPQLSTGSLNNTQTSR